MNFQIYFCSDGVLRAQFREDNPKIPVVLMQEKLKLKDFEFWVRIFNNVTYFEDGLTVGSFLKCLEPWEDFLSVLLNIDLPAYIKESRKPSIVRDDTLSWITLSYSTTISPEIEYLEKIEESDLLDWLNSKKNICLTGNWGVESKYTLSGYKAGEEEHYSVEYTPMNEIVNVPLYLSEDYNILFEEFYLNKVINKKSIFSEETFGVRHLQVNKEDTSGLSLKYLKSKKYHKLFDVLNGFWDWMSYSPFYREELNEKLSSAIEEIKSMRQENQEDNDTLYDPEDTEQKPLTIEIAPNAFSDIVEENETKKDFWDDLIKEASSHPLPVQIGKIKEGVPPEKRVLSYIIQEEDLSTPYKEI